MFLKIMMFLLSLYQGVNAATANFTAAELKKFKRRMEHQPEIKDCSKMDFQKSQKELSSSILSTGVWEEDQSRKTDLVIAPDIIESFGSIDLLVDSSAQGKRDSIKEDETNATPDSKDSQEK